MSQVLDGIPTRFVIATAITVAALLVLAGFTLLGSTGDPADDRRRAEVTSSSVAPTAPAVTVEEPQDTTTTSIAIRPDWFPKQTSSYSDRQPVVTVTTLPPTTTEQPAGSSSRGSTGGGG